MDKLKKCLIKTVTFHNETNGYTVLKCDNENYNWPLTIVGHMPMPRIDTTFNFAGEWKTHPKYGRQFMFEDFEEVFPVDTENLEKYLASGLIKGIGAKMAHRIVSKFGADTIDIIDNNPDRLREVSGIGTATLERIKKCWHEYRKIQDIMIFLKGHDLSTSLAMKVYNYYGDESIDVLTKNPYRLVEIQGVGFKTADGAASKMGFGKEHPARIHSGIFYTLQKFAEDGHCFARKNELIQKAAEILALHEALITSHVLKMKDDEYIKVDGDAYYLPYLYYSETGTARKISGLMNYSQRNKYTEQEVRKKIDYKINVNGEFVNFTDEQINAITQAMNNRVFIITGGPGTGKTTAVRAIIKIYEDSSKKVLLAAPTGRAAKRLNEVTKHEAKTIHRLVGINFQGAATHDERDPLEANVLIVDECSMIDITLMYTLLKAVPPDMSLILIGDIDQLPSVGPGKVLADMIKSGVVPCAKLTQIQRQALGSKIIMNAHKINNGLMPNLNDDKESDFYFTSMYDAEMTADYIKTFCEKNMLPDNRESWADIQVLAPMRKGVIGIENLNHLIQDAINPSYYDKAFIKRGDTEYRLRDKVMQIRNDYDKSVFNGDIGIITHIDSLEKSLTVSFDDVRNVYYKYEELEDLVLAYAITIHKSQGSEYKKVIIPLMMSQYIMLQRNLIYTGVTRAKDSLTLVGEEKAIFCAVKNNRISQRNTKLAERLQAEIDCS